jgi:hypothetical protein
MYKASPPLLLFPLSSFIFFHHNHFANLPRCYKATELGH